MTKKPPPGGWAKTFDTPDDAPVDIEDMVNPALRDFANRLQGLKSMCVDNGINFDEVTIYYQSLMRHPSKQGHNVSEVLDATIDHVKRVIARKAITEGSAPILALAWVTPEYTAHVQRYAAQHEQFIVTAQQIGFPEQQAEDIWTQKLAESQRLPFVVDLFTSACQSMADEVRKIAETAAKIEPLRRKFGI